jgi:hypothetical protein
MAEMMQAQKGKGNNYFPIFTGGRVSGKGTAIKQFFAQRD